MAVMNLEYIKKMVNIFADTNMPFKYLMEPVIRGYNQLSEEEQKKFCSWLAGPNPNEKMCKYCNGSHEYRELEDKEVDAFVRDDNALEVQMCFYDTSNSTKMGYACALAINYCPWCGRKLEEENEH